MITSPTLWGMMKDEVENGIYRLVGTGAPASTAGAGFAGVGSTYIDLATGNNYRNIGTIVTPVWVQVGGTSAVIQQLSGSISPANIIGTGAGQFGHANGVILAPALGTHVTIELVSVVVNFVRLTAAYTGGGNITVNQGGGGAALTGLVSAANSLGNAASKSYTFVPLSTVAIPNVENGPINLVAASAFTNPGTAAGTVNWIINYRQYPTGF